MSGSENMAVSNARTVFAVLAAMKLVAVLFGVRLLLGVPSVPNRAIAEMLREHQYLVAMVLIVYFGAQFALCLALRRGLGLGRAWAFTVG